MTATLVWAGLARGSTPEGQLLVIVAGSGIRMIFVIVAGVLLHQTIPALEDDRFLLWVVFFYLATLAISRLAPHTPAPEQDPAAAPRAPGATAAAPADAGQPA